MCGVFKGSGISVVLTREYHKINALLQRDVQQLILVQPYIHTYTQVSVVVGDDKIDLIFNKDKV